MSKLCAFIKLDSFMAQAQAIYCVSQPHLQKIPKEYIVDQLSRRIADDIINNGFYELTTRKTADVGMPMEEYRMTVKVFPNGSPALAVLKSEYQKLEDRIAELENELAVLKFSKRDCPYEI